LLGFYLESFWGVFSVKMEAQLDWRYLNEYLKRTFRETRPQQHYIELSGFVGDYEIQKIQELCKFYDCELQSVNSHTESNSLTKTFWKSQIIISTNASLERALFQQRNNPDFLLNNLF